jgi:hypothetical protein
VCMTTYTQLHKDEKRALETTGNGMFNSFDTLMQGVQSSQEDGLGFGNSFAEAQKKMLVIYQELCEKKVYKYDIDRYNECKKNLETGITLMDKVEKKFKYASTYRILKERSETCQHKLANYANAWETIRTFDVNNKNPNVMRTGG